MDIVWKNEKQPRQAHHNAAAVAFTDEEDRGLEGACLQTSNKPLRFVQNGAKRRRKTNKLPKVINQFMTTVHPTAPLADEQCSPQDPITTPSLYDYNDMPITEGLDESLGISLDTNWPEATMEFLDSARGTPSSSQSEPYDSPTGLLLHPSDFDLDGSDFRWYRHGSGQAMQLHRHVSPQSPDFVADLFPLSPGPLFSSTTQKAAAILDMYDQEFCILPLTADCLSNPFRVRKDSCEGSAFLLHAILAISSQHLAKKNNSVVLATEMWNHQATALRLFSEALDYMPASKLLDTLLLLVNFEATQTASSTWGVHLSGAQKLLESMGGVNFCQKGSRARAQVAMLVWWDVTVAIISRKRPLLPLQYLETLMKHDEEDGWTFFTLNGCPAELVKFMARLAMLASTYEKVLTMEWATFSTFPVEEIIEQLQKWENSEDATADSITWTDDDPENRRNRFHCIEAWRHAILLYAYRVFYRPQTGTGLRSITHLARVVLDHVRCIPDTAMVQKQTLLPVFLAASEVGDETTRGFVRQFCSHWSSTARYSMFGTVATLLETIWAGWDVSTRNIYWWGIKVGNNSSEPASGDERLVSELLLG